MGRPPAGCGRPPRQAHRRRAPAGPPRRRVPHGRARCRSPARRGRPPTSPARDRCRGGSTRTARAPSRPRPSRGTPRLRLGSGRRRRRRSARAPTALRLLLPWRTRLRRARRAARTRRRRGRRPRAACPRQAGARPSPRPSARNRGDRRSHTDHRHQCECRRSRRPRQTDAPAEPARRDGGVDERRLDSAAAMRRYGSDVMVDAIKACGFRFLPLNPGSSYRGLHDSLVNYGGNDPEIITCNHEKLAVGIAHGYAKAAREPAACVLHDIVGLLQGTMGIYYAWIDRAPVVVFGGAGPMAYDRRRPNIDWIHTANIQGNVVRDYTKWDDQPASVASVPESVMRAYRIASAQPQGPTYIALDAGLQEDELDAEVPLPDWNRLRTPSSVGPDPAALRRLADRLCAAERPLVVTSYAGRDAHAFAQLTELSELLGAGVIDTGWRLNFPNRHPHAVTMELLPECDCVLFVDVKDMGKWTQKLDRTTRRIGTLIPRAAGVLDVGSTDLGIGAWSPNPAQRPEPAVQVTADTA